jgi:hypothetical protein
MTTHITEAEIETLEAAITDTEWNSACAAIKAARDGLFPPDWHEVVRVGGIMDRFVKRFGDYNGTPLHVVTPT